MCSKRRGQLSNQRIERLTVNKLNYGLIQQYKPLSGVEHKSLSNGKLHFHRREPREWRPYLLDPMKRFWVRKRRRTLVLSLMTRMRGTVNFFHWFSYIFGCSSANKSFIGIGVLLFPFYRGYLCISEILYHNFRLLLGLPQNIFLLIYFDMIVEISISCPLWSYVKEI